MERAREFGFRFNADKHQIRCTETQLLGHIISVSGLLRPDPQKANLAISNMDPSMSLADLQTFLVSQPLLAQPGMTLSRPLGSH